MASVNRREGKADEFINFLEKVNELTDLCIDRELFEYVLPGNDFCIFKLNGSANEYFNDFAAGSSPPEYFKPIEGCPVEKITLPVEPDDFLTYLAGYDSYDFSKLNCTSESTSTSEDHQFDLCWSNLFWVKILRAQIMRQNKDNFLNRLDYLLLYLEKHLPRDSDIKGEKPANKGEKRGRWENWHITLFTCLMELSAIAVGEASYGYAERARNIIGKIYPPFTPERKNYDRWIWYNMGLAYQHVGRDKKAVIEFNRVIYNFFEEAETRKKSQAIDNSDYILEYLLNIYPSILQRASINLKMQLSYHALQTLVDKPATFFNNLQNRGNGRLLRNTISNLKQRSDLLTVEACIQMDRLENAKNIIESLCSNNGIELKYTSEDTKPILENDNIPKSISVQLIEQVVSYIFQRIDTQKRRMAEQLNQDSNCIINLHFFRTAKQLKNLVGILKDNSYYRSAIKNNFDKRSYYTKSGKVLNLSIDFLRQITERYFDKNCDVTRLSEYLFSSVFKDIITFYYFMLNNFRLEPFTEDKYVFETFRSDDYYDYVTGLTSFYKAINKYLSCEGPVREITQTELLSGFNSNEIDKVISEIKDKHQKLLDALDRYQVGFSENLQVERLKLYNDRLIWEEQGDLQKSCVLELDSCINTNINNKFDKGFRGLLTCVPNLTEPIAEGYSVSNYSNCHDYEYIMSQTEGHLIKHLKGFSKHYPNKNTLNFMGLQRWNSLTPAQGKSVGGGYFLYETDDRSMVTLGIAIDPGFDFIRNFFRMGFSLRDIDVVLISHSHPDHIWDFESIIQLLKELHDKTDVLHRINVVLTLGAYNRLNRVINNQALRKYMDTMVIDIRKEIDPEYFNKLTDGYGEEVNSNSYNEGCIERCFRFKTDEKKSGGSRLKKLDRPPWVSTIPRANSDGRSYLEIWPTRAYHDDYSQLSDSFGFLIKFPGLDNNDKRTCFGYTGDTKWVDNHLYGDKKFYGAHPFAAIAEQYKKCDVILMHLGSLIKHKGKNGKKFAYYSSPKQCEELIRKENHPYLMGMIRFLSKIYEIGKEFPKLILIGEFGEELKGGIRTDLVRRLRQGIAPEWKIIPVDVGLDILMQEFDTKPNNQNKQKKPFQFLCVLCNCYHDIEEIDYQHYGQDEAIFHVCKTCKKAVPLDVQQTTFKQLYEIGRELYTEDDDF